jgi:hypothetical protein
VYELRVRFQGEESFLQNRCPVHSLMVNRRFHTEIYSRSYCADSLVMYYWSIYILADGCLRTANIFRPYHKMHGGTRECHMNTIEVSLIAHMGTGCKPLVLGSWAPMPTHTAQRRQYLTVAKFYSLSTNQDGSSLLRRYWLYSAFFIVTAVETSNLTYRDAS